jgi:hypothetical protein
MGMFDLFSGVGNMLDSFMHPERGYKEAQKPLKESWNQAQGFQLPFLNNGKAQINPLTDAETKLMHPGDLQNEWASQYEQSPYAQQLLKQNQAQGMDAASAMGLNGSSAAIGNIQQGAGEIMSKDRQQFMDDLMRKFLAAIGIGQDIYGKGAATAGNLGQQSMGFGENMANLRGNEVNAPGNQFNNLLKTAAQFFGGSSGAPAGAGG